AIGLTSSLAAQELRGVARDNGSGLPVPGVVLLLLDSARNTLGRNITNERGEYRIALTPQMRRIRTLRIGFRPSEYPIPVFTSGSRQLDLTLTQVATLLEPVRVDDSPNCPARKDRAAALALWEQ